MIPFGKLHWLAAATCLGTSSCLGVVTDISSSLHFNEGYGYSISPDTQNAPYYEVLTAIDHTGRIVTCGTRSNSAGGKEVIVHRYLGSGSIDTSFNSGQGYVILREGLASLDGSSNATKDDGCVAVITHPQTDAIYVLFGLWGNTNYSAVARFTSSGALDTAFGTSGYYLTPTVAFGGDATWGDTIVGMYINSDDSLMLVGTTYSAASRSEPIVVKLTSSGALDTTWASGGYSIFKHNGTGVNGNVGRSEVPSGFAADSAGNAYWLGYASENTGTGWDLCVIKFKTDGTVDTTWGNVGNGAFYYGSGAANAAGAAVNAKIIYPYSGKFDSSGRLVVVAKIVGPAGIYQGAIYRLTSAGQLDTAFGTTASGVTVLNMNQAALGGSYAYASKSESLTAVDIDSSGRIYAYGLSGASAGGAGNDLFPLLVSFTNAGALDTTFTSTGYKLYTRADGASFLGGTSAAGRLRSWGKGMKVDRLDRIVMTAVAVDNSGNSREVVYRALGNGALNN